MSLSKIIFAGTGDASKFLDVNFFQLTGSGITNELLTFRTAIAKWYYILRLISVAILLVILIYVGIRMALSTIASEQAKYKQMLVDWVTSLALLFLLHYIIIFAITANGSIVTALSKVFESDITEDMIKNLILIMFWPGLEGLFAALVYLVFVGQIFSFLLMYIKRMVTVGFLIMIAPLITITYSIDKIGDGKAQALNAWLKELVYNILIQPFHCVIFMAFFDAIASMFKSNAFGIGAYVFAIVVMQFMKKAEEILRKIFHFEASSMSSLKESGQSIANATGTFVKTGMKVGGAVAGIKAAGGFTSAKEKYQDFRASQRARKQLKQYYKDDIKGKNGPPSITAGSFKEYEQSAQGLQKFTAFKQSNASQMATRAEENRAKKKEKREQKVKEKAEMQLRNEMGDATYESLKARADGGDEAAKRVITDKEDKVRQGSFPKRTIKGVASFAGNAASGAWNSAKEGKKRFFATDYGKLVSAAAKDSTKVAGLLAGAAFGAGLGDFKTAVSLGQAGYGFAAGYLKQSTGTLVGDSVDKAQQIAATLGLDVNNPEVIQSILASVRQEKAAGHLDPKAITAELDKLENIIESLYSDRNQGNIDFNAFKCELEAAAHLKELNSQEAIRDLIENNFSHFDDDDKAKIEISARNYINKTLMGGIATNQSAMESSERDVDEHDLRVTEKASSTNFSA